MAQRLVRVICADCKTPCEPESGESPPDAGLDGRTDLYRARGCRECRNTGFQGRVGIYELLEVSQRTRELVMARANATQIAKSATEAGELSLLRDAGLAKVRSGVTSVAEVLRATQG